MASSLPAVSYTEEVIECMYGATLCLTLFKLYSTVSRFGVILGAGGSNLLLSRHNMFFTLNSVPLLFKLDDNLFDF